MMSTTPTSLSSLSLLLLLGASTVSVSATPFYKMDPSRPWRKEIEVDMTRRQTTGTTAGSDACTAIAGLTFVSPAEATACLNMFPFSETIRTNILDNIAGVMEFYTFETYALNSPAPFEGSKIDVQAEISRMRTQTYASDYAFHYDVVNTLNSGLNDGHTIFESPCYWGAFQSILPFPIVALAPSANSSLSDVEIRIAPDATSITRNLGSRFLASYGIDDFSVYNGALVTQINGMPATEYVEFVADTVTGTYLDLGVRTNSVFTSYRLTAASTFSQRFGDFAGILFPDTAGVNMTVQRVNSTTPETLNAPYQSFYLGEDFSDADSYYEANCAVLSTTNGGNLNRTITSTSTSESENSDSVADISTASDDVDEEEPAQRGRPRESYIASIKNDVTEKFAASLLENVVPGGEIQSSLTNDTGIKFFVLPSDPTVGVMMIGTFGPSSFDAAEEAMVNGLLILARTTTSLIIDVSNNGGGFLCLGHLLHRVLAGPDVENNLGFESAWRAAPLALKIMAANIQMRLTNTFYSPVGWNNLEGNSLSVNNNLFSPGVSVQAEGTTDAQSTRFADECGSTRGYPTTQPYDLTKVAIVGNGNCASTCATFTTLMSELHNTRMYIYGGSPSVETIQYKGMAGNQVLDWADLDTEIISAGLTDDPLRPPQLIVNGNARHNWRIAYSWINKNNPIAYQNEAATVRIPLTLATYNNPEAIWTQVAADLKANPQSASSGASASATNTASNPGATGSSQSGAASPIRSTTPWIGGLVSLLAGVVMMA
ncbi:hypothetical protein BDY24DRAFT_385182 [Mrakia frigida]|uniref:uncharacterized protein n=1 Tax=Mrakia frigida TaxID=29902 RepID=UPI003FCBF3AB